MTDKKNPYAEFDFAGVFKAMQENPMMKAWQESDFFKKLPMANFSETDMEAIWEAQKKNLESLNQVNANLGENVKELAQKQARMMGEAWDTMKAFSEDAVKTGEGDLGAQFDKAKDVFEQASVNVQEMSKRGLEMSESVAQEMQNRLSQSIQDLQDLVDKYQK